MRISDWSSDVCSSDLRLRSRREPHSLGGHYAPSDRQQTPACSKRATDGYAFGVAYPADRSWRAHADRGSYCRHAGPRCLWLVGRGRGRSFRAGGYRSEEHTSELQSLMRISYAVFCLKKKKKNTQ